MQKDASWEDWQCWEVTVGLVCAIAGSITHLLFQFQWRAKLGERDRQLKRREAAFIIPSRYKKSKNTQLRDRGKKVPFGRKESCFGYTILISAHSDPVPEMFDEVFRVVRGFYPINSEEELLTC